MDVLWCSFQNLNLVLKGQLILKCLFGIFNSPKKTNEWIRLYYYGAASCTIFVCFLGELKTPKRHFEIKWPLVCKSPECISAHKLHVHCPQMHASYRNSKGYYVTPIKVHILWEGHKDLSYVVPVKPTLEICKILWPTQDIIWTLLWLDKSEYFWKTLNWSFTA